MILKLTHANHDNRPVYFASPPPAWHYNGPTACVLVYTANNNCIPVKETAEQIAEMIQKLNSHQVAGESNERTKTV